MRVIITGGTGMLGRPLTSALCAANHEVIVLSRSPEKVRGLPAGAAVHPWDARTGDGWFEMIDADTVIVNLAGENIGGEGFIPPRWTAARKRRIRESRIHVGRAVVDAVRRAPAKPRAVVQASGINYYGATTQDTVIDETSPAGDDFLASVCLDWEGATAPVAEFGVRQIVTRTGLVLSTRSGPLTRIILPFRLFVGGPFGSGRQYWSWIHLDDQVQATKYLIEHPSATGAFNLVAPNPAPMKELGRTLGKVMKRPSWLPVPGFAMRLALGEVAVLVLEGQRALPRALETLGFKFAFPDLESALRDLFARRR